MAILHCDDSVILVYFADESELRGLVGSDGSERGVSIRCRSETDANARRAQGKQGTNESACKHVCTHAHTKICVNARQIHCAIRNTSEFFVLTLTEWNSLY